MKRLCECGCGAAVNKRFVSGHNRVMQDIHARYTQEDRGFSTPCWIWPVPKGTTDGYGRIKLRGVLTPQLAHRVFFEERYGYKPSELHHGCAVRACVNPEHLVPTSHSTHPVLEATRRTTCRKGHSHEELGLAQACDRARALEHEADCVFNDLTKAQERCAEVRIDATVNLTPGVQAAYSAWKQNRAGEQGRQIARQDHGWPMRDSA